MSYGKLQLNILASIKQDRVNFSKADKSRLAKLNYLKTRIEMMEKQFTLAEHYHQQILGTGKVEAELSIDDLQTAYENIRETYADYRTEVLDAIDKLTPEESPVISAKTRDTSSSDAKVSELRLPVITLPTFSGSYESWRSFHDMFISLVHTNTTLSEVQKMHFLKCNVSGDAGRLLQHLAIDKGNYYRAWEILTERYDHKRVLVNTQLKLLFGQASMSSETADNIKRILDTSKEIIHSLENLEVPVKHWDAILIFVILQKLCNTTQQLWEERLGSSKELPKTKDFFDFLQCRFRTLEAVEQQSFAKNGNKTKPTTQVLHTRQTQKRQINCKVCQKGPHSLRECRRFLEMDVGQRKQTVFNIRVCENCLAYSHFKNKCPSSKSCYHCKQRHNTLLHPIPQNMSNINPNAPQFVPNSTQMQQYTANNWSTATNNCQSQGTQQNNPNQPHGQSQIENNLPSTSQNYRVHHVNTNSQILLSTALVSVKTGNGSYLTLRALIDTGSEASFITEAAVQRLNLKTRWTFSKISGLGEVSSGASTKIVDLKIGSLTSNFASRIQALVLKSLTGLLPTQYTNVENLSHLGGLQLADPTFNIPAKVDMLLGSDIYGEIILGEVVRNSECSGPIAQRTHLGWIVLGKVPPTESNTIRTFFNQVDLNTTMKRFWEIEEEPYEKYESEEDKKCEEHFKKYTKRLPDGRYEVRLPFKGGEYPSMGPTQNGAVRRFLQLEKRLQANPTQHQEYAKCMAEYLELGHMTPVEDSNEVLNSTFHFFIPHHAVIKESSTTTKLRIVFDATFKPFFGSSLNDKLMVGPKVQTNVMDIILRWRKYRFTFTGDVEKMYRQIRVNTTDANYQLILWRDNPNQKLKIYRLETVTFGTASAPYLAIRVFLQLADDEASTFPLATSVIREETYVDDVISGADTIEETQLKLQSVKDLLATAGFHLRKHVSNSEEVLRNIPPSDRAVDFSLPFVETSDVKTLGIRWLPVPDVFSFQVTQISDGEVTKRSILSAIAKLYDPMGWISPCTIKAKIMMQQLWGRGLDWDKPIPTKLEQEWLTFRQELPAIERVQIRRWINTDRNISKLEVHGFCDASEKAYAAAVYLRVLDGNRQIHMHLLMAKTKVAPLETITLPRLELCGAVLLAKLLHDTTKILKLEAADVYAWTDSVITLCWIRAPPLKWKTFICNRVSQIQKLSIQTTWKHIPSELNPADIASRGIFPSMIIENQLWWEGPTFLRHQWDAIHPEQPSCLETPQEARSTAVLHCLENKAMSVVTQILKNCSTLGKAVRVVAYCLRMRTKARPSQQYTDILSPQEFDKALTRIIQAVQKETFDSEVEGYKALTPFRDGEGILRVGGRLSNSTLPFNRKHPILLKADHLFSKRIISDAHEKTLHGGNEKMISYIRQRFWIFNLKNAVKQQIHNCNICFKFRAKPLRQLMGNLPPSRTTISRPFTYSGVDYAGPIDVKTWRGRNAKILKGYIAIFVCMATKALHVELVSDMTTQTFLAAFRRLVARRGLCRELFSDCGRNFVGGNVELNKQLKEAQFDWKNVAEVLASEGTKWNFIPPASPHFGGLWEAGVKSVKFHLKRVAGNQILTFEELTTLLTQVEACLNSRPLCPTSEDINDLEAITPGHFLVGEPLITPPQPEYKLEKISHLERWKRVQALSQSFWKLWSNEYLARLQQRPKWTQIEDSKLKEGDLVLIKDERLPPLKWNLGRILKLHPGADNLVRVVTLKTETTELKRPISKICPLPSNTSNTINLIQHN